MVIITSAAVKRNQPTLYQGIQAEFTPEETDYQVNKGHGRLEKRKVSICKIQGNYPDWIGLKTGATQKSGIDPIQSRQGFEESGRSERVQKASPSPPTCSQLRCAEDASAAKRKIYSRELIANKSDR